MDLTHCSTPPHLVLQTKIRNFILATFTDRMTEREIRQVALSNFTIAPKVNDDYRVTVH